MKVHMMGNILVGFLLLSSPCVAAENVFSFGAEFSDYTYEEPDFMEDSGYLYGIIGRYEYHHQGYAGLLPNIVYGIEGRFATGKVDYKSVGTGTNENIRDYVFALRGEIGYDFELGRKWLLTPYLGYGYRYLNDGGTGQVTTTGHYGYERQSRYYFSPIGAVLTWQIGGSWSLGLQVEYDYFWHGMQKSFLSDVSTAYPDVENRQDTGYGVQGSLRLRKQIGEMALRLEPYYRYWNIDDSEVAYFVVANYWLFSGIEPENNTKEYGLRMVWEF